MNFIKKLCFGIAIGSGAILPGISSGVLCVILGIYDKLVDSVIHFFSDMKKNFMFLFPILLGMGIGIITFGNILKVLFEKCYVPTAFCFIGLILGAVPLLIKKANNKKGFRLHYVLYFLITFLLTIVSLNIENSYVVSYASNPTFFYLILCGFFMSIGIVVPGVSSTVILMLFGVYEVYLSSIACINLSVLFPIAIGLIIGGLLFLKVINFLLTNYFSQTYYAIIGFTVSSIFVLYPGIGFNFESFLGLLLFFICFKAGYLLEKL